MATDTRALAVANGTAQEPASLVPTFAITLDQVKDRITQLQKFVQFYMVEGEDYGRIPNTPKPTLLKPGAEKLCDVYGFSKQVEVINRIEDWENGFFQYEVKVTLVSKRSGLVEAEGIGSCNSKEKRYRNQDAFSLVNTVLKMAKKRALVDAVLSATRSSGIFTQDVEDFIDADFDEERPAPRRTEQRQATRPANGTTKAAPQGRTDIYTCKQCNEPIQPMTIEGRTWSPFRLAKYSESKCGIQLCPECAKSVKDNALPQDDPLWEQVQRAHEDASEVGVELPKIWEWSTKEDVQKWLDESAALLAQAS